MEVSKVDELIITLECSIMVINLGALGIQLVKYL